MGVMSRARVLGYRSATTADGRLYIFVPASRRRRRRRIITMGQFTQHSATVPSGKPTSRWAAVDEEVTARFPALYEYLAEQCSEEGAARVTSTLLLSAEDGMWKAKLTDRAQKGGSFDYLLWRSGETVADALRALDEALQSGRADWRKWQTFQSQKKR